MQSVAASPKSNKIMFWVGWVITVLITLAMTMDAVMKIAKPAVIVEGSAKAGIPESTLVGIGLALLVSVICYAIPKTSILGAILLTGYLGGAVVTHVRLEDSAMNIAMPVIFGVITWLGPFFREPRLRALVPLRSMLGDSAY